jgi:rRNA maturation protein Nop10
MKRMRKCPSCMEYSLSEMHCGGRSMPAHPPKYNPNDRYAGYRRKEKGMSDG